MRVRDVLVGIGALVLLAGCGSSGARHAAGDERLVSVLAATESSNSFRYQTVIHQVTSGASHQTSSTTIDGVVDDEHKRGSNTARSDAGGASTQYRWLDGIGYQQFGSELAGLYGAPKGTRWISTDGDRIADADGCARYFVGSAANPLLGGTLSVGLPRPEGVLDSLRETGATLDKVGSDEVRGTATTHWSVDATSVTTTTIPANCYPRLPGVHESPRRVEIWTDAQNRLRRVVVMSTTTVTRGLLGQSFADLPDPGPSTFARTITTEFFDFGGAVRVEAPPANQVFDATAVVAAMLAGAGSVTDADWQNVAHGSFHGTDWKIWFARTSTNWRCYDTEGLPQSPDDVVGSPIADIYPKHDGKPADCSPAVVGSDNRPLTAFIAGVDGARWVLVGRVDGAEDNARLRFADGSSIALPIDAQSGIVQWSGPASPAPTEYEAGDARCTLSDDVETTGDEQTCDGTTSMTFVNGGAALVPKR